jgi:AcrR family transcriptional regulator
VQTVGGRSYLWVKSMEACVARQATRRSSLREEHKLFTRRRLIDAALEVFEERGYVRATIDDIAEAAGTSRATFYLHFASKLALVHALAEELRPELMAHWQDLDAALLDPSGDRLRDAIDAVAGWVEAHQIFASVVAEVRAVERGGEKDEVPRVGADADWLKGYLGQLPKSQRRLGVFRVAILVEQVAIACELFLSGDFNVSRDELVDELTDLWRSTLDLGERARGSRRSDHQAPRSASSASGARGPRGAGSARPTNQ